MAKSKKSGDGQQASALPPYRPKSPGASQPVSLLAKATKTPPAVLAALKGEYGWTDTTAISRSEFLAKRDAWLKQPAGR